MNHPDVIIPFAPQPHDVICSRGGYRVHPGNQFYHKLLKKCILRSSRHTIISKPDNDAIVDAIMDVIVEKRRGRFVRPDDDTKRFAMVLNRNEAAYKIRNDLRTRRARLLAKAESKKHVSSATSRCLQKIAAKSLKTPSRSVAMMPEANRKMVKKVAEHGVREAASQKVRRSSFGNGDDFDDDDEDDDDNSHSSSRPVAASSHPRAALKSHRDLKPAPVAQPAPAAVTSSSPSPSFVGSSPPSSSSSALLSSSSSTMRKKLLHEAAVASNDSNSGSLILYGSEHDEIHMRRWLNTHQLPQSVGDVLLELGARSVEDVNLLVKAQPKMLQQLPVLDMVKLQRAVTASK